MHLIHVTNIENFKGIINNKFKISQCREIFEYVDLENSQTSRGDFFFPMISFFGMTLDEHIRFNNNYGNLGLIFDDEILKRSDLNPVRYVLKYSIIAKNITEFEKNKVNVSFTGSTPIISGAGGISTYMFEMFLKNEGNGFRYNSIRMWMENIAYSKNFHSELERRDKNTGEYIIVDENYYFGLEREWRIIPKRLFTNFDKTNVRMNDDEFAEIYTNIDLLKYLIRIIVNPINKDSVQKILSQYKLSSIEIICDDNYNK